MTRSTTLAAIEAIAETLETMGPEKAANPLVIAVAAVTALEDADLLAVTPRAPVKRGAE